VLDHWSDRRTLEAVRYLRNWDCRMEPDRVAASIFSVFFSHWTKAAVHERFDPGEASLLAGGADGLAANLIYVDQSVWSPGATSEKAMLASFHAALPTLKDRFGDDMAAWTWGPLHTVRLRHVLSVRRGLGKLIDHIGMPVKGDAGTVCNTGLGG